MHQSLEHPLCFGYAEVHSATAESAAADIIVRICAVRFILAEPTIVRTFDPHACAMLLPSGSWFDLIARVDGVGVFVDKVPRCTVNQRVALIDTYGQEIAWSMIARVAA